MVISRAGAAYLFQSQTGRVRRPKLAGIAVQLGLRGRLIGASWGVGAGLVWGLGEFFFEGTWNRQTYDVFCFHVIDTGHP